MNDIFTVDWMFEISEFQNKKEILITPLHIFKKGGYDDNVKIVICKSGDLEANDNTAIPNHIKKIYTTNCNRQPDCRFIGIPYGTLLPQAQVISKIKNENIKKKYLVYCNFGINSHRSRPIIWNMMKSLNFVYTENLGKPGDVQTEKMLIQYFSQVLSSKFVICPRGNGIDTYRMWECLMLNIIPIVPKSAMIEHFKYDLPILDVDNYNLTESFLNKEYERINNTNYKKNFLKKEYWIQQWRKDLNE